jgi:hypothetical protein
MWEGNYYGFPHAACMQFCRTLKPEFFDAFEQHALHVADVHTVHWDDAAEEGRAAFWTGASRYCPPPEHVRMDEEKDDYPVYVSNTFNHHKAQEIFERWYFLADHRMLDVVGEIGDFIMRYDDADYDKSQPRGPGFLMMTIYEFCCFTANDPKWLERGRKVVKANQDRKLIVNYQTGFKLEGLRRLHEAFGDQGHLELLTKWCDQLIAAGKSGAECNVAQAMGYVYGQTGDQKYLDYAVRCLKQSKAEKGIHQFASVMRSGMYMSYWLSKDAVIKKPQGAGAGAGATEAR